MNYLICCNDAGGAEVVAAWVKANSKNNYKYIIQGPAVSIFERVIGEIVNYSLEDLIFKNIDCVLTGTSWSSELECEVIKRAKKLNIKTSSYIDHWVNYKERFGFPNNGWKENLPDEIWYGDEYAGRILLSEGFCKDSLIYKENEYFNTIKKQFNYSSTEPVWDYLYICEPVEDHMKKQYSDPMYLGYTEFTAMERFFNFIKEQNKSGVLVRLHPSENAGKYNSIIEKYRENIKIETSSYTTLQEDIKSAKTVVGCESMALIIALLAGKSVYTVIADDWSKCRLPFKEIKRFRSNNEN